MSGNSHSHSNSYSIIVGAIHSAWTHAARREWHFSSLIYVLIVAPAAWMMYNYLFRLRGVPGPLHAKLGIPGVLAYWAVRLEWVWRVEDLHRKHGPVVRIGPNQVDFSSTTALQQIYGHGSRYHKPKRFYDSFVVVKNNPSIFSDTDPHSHAARRRAVSAAYALNYLVKMEECVDPLVDVLVKRLYEAMVDGTKATLDMTKVLHFFAMDAVGELAFGQSFGLLEAFEDRAKFLRGVSNLSQWAGAIGFLPACCHSLARRAFKRLLNEPGGEVIAQATRSRIDARYELLAEGKEPLRNDMLGKFVEAKHADGTPYTRNQVLFTSTSVIAAGSDTTSLALSGVLRYLVASPDVYARAQAQVDEAFETGRLTEPAEYNAAVKLDYLQACIKETLRLHPPISMSLPRVVPPGGDVIDGQFYPAGTIVGISPYILHRDRAIWGDDAAQFKPERWLNVDEEQRRHLERNFFAFGGGARQCLGKNISMMEVTKTLPRLLWHFKFEVSETAQSRRDGGEPWQTSSSWFLNAEHLDLDVFARRPDERDAIVNAF